MLKTLPDRSLCGYDVGCAFAETILRTSLAPEVKHKLLKFCVPAFHGYTHCYACQLLNHPNVIEGIGLEDLEEMERIFSLSNYLAPNTRFA